MQEYDIPDYLPDDFRKFFQHFSGKYPSETKGIRVNTISYLVLMVGLYFHQNAEEIMDVLDQQIGTDGFLQMIVRLHEDVKKDLKSQIEEKNQAMLEKNEQILKLEGEMKDIRIMMDKKEILIHELEERAKQLAEEEQEEAAPPETKNQRVIRKLQEEIAASKIEKEEHEEIKKLKKQLKELQKEERPYAALNDHLLQTTDFSDEQMDILIRARNAGIPEEDILAFAKPEKTAHQMQQCVEFLQMRCGIAPSWDPETGTEKKDSSDQKKSRRKRIWRKEKE